MRSTVRGRAISRRLTGRGLSARLNASHRLIIANASSLVGATAVTSALGVVYWWLAARHFSTAAVGFASATISSMTLLGTIAMLGFGTMLMGELPRHRGSEGRMISSALATVGGVGIILGIVFALLAPLLSSGLRPLSASVGAVALFAAGVGLTAVALVVDLAVIGLLRGGLQLARNSLFALSKLGLLAALSLWAASSFGLSIYATWAGGNAVSLLYLTVIVLRRRNRQPLRPQWSMMRSAGRVALLHHLLNLSLQAPTLILPLVVTTILSTETNAAFYIAWMIAGFLYIGPISLSLVLYAADAAQPDDLQRKLWLTLGLSFAIGVVGEAALIVLSGTALRVFGHAYAQRAGVCLPILGAAVFGMIIRDHYVTLCRIRGAVLRATAVVTLGDALEVGAAIVGALLAGLTGLAIGYVLALCVEAAVMGGPVVSATRRGQPQQRDVALAAFDAPG